jgi:plasmid stabilization system protein ParE
VPRPRNLLLSFQAAEDLDLIADPLRTEVIQRPRLLKRFPSLGSLVSAEFHGVRATTVGIFRIFYRVTARGVEVIFIRHCRRRVPDFEEE